MFCNFSEDLQLFPNEKFKKRKRKDIDVAWQPWVFMKTYMSGLTGKTLPKTLHFFVFPNDKGIIPQASHV